MPSAPDLSGVALDGRYELHSLIGEGAFGRVYRGRDRRLARRVAVKVIKPWWAEDPDWVRSFEHEAQLLASISDAGIVQIFDVGSAPEGLYYVAELVDGESLANRLRSGRLPPWEACEIAEQLARALAQAHAQRVVHRDVKPANVLIASDGRVKVGDFGVARLAEGTGDAAVATVAGTPRYMAPEQAAGGPTSPATDVYGIGIVLYEMLAGHPPFTGETAVELALRHLHDLPPPLPHSTPRPLVEVIDRALAKNPTERYADGRELAAALERTRASLVVSDEDWEPPETGRTSAPTGGVATLAPPEPSTSVTQVAEPLVRAAIPPTRVGGGMSARRNFNPPERRQRIAIFAAVVLVGLGMVAAAIDLAPKHLKVPSLHGMTRNRIIAKARRLDFHAAFTSRYSQARRGTAIGQSPGPGTRVTDGSTVAVVLSGGPPPVSVPKLAGRPLNDAEAVLGALKLRSDVTSVPAPGVAPGTVTAESPAAGASLAPGSVVALSVAESPRLRDLITFTGDGNGRSVPFQIRGSRWEIVYRMSYEGMCTLIFICSGPSATVTNLHSGATVDSFGLGEGDRETRVFKSGPGTYQIRISPGSDTARWAVTVLDYY
jgi:serine/threonine protein kinase